MEKTFSNGREKERMNKYVLSQAFLKVQCNIDLCWHIMHVSQIVNQWKGF